MASTDIAYGMSLRFKVVIDEQVELGDWTKCEGLSVEYDVQEVKEGGNNDFIHRLPGRVKYQNLKLTRPCNPASKAVAAWLTSVSSLPHRCTAQISLLDTSGKPVSVWHVKGIVPVKWTGPSLDVGSNTVAFEVLELVHNGFI